MRFIGTDRYVHGTPERRRRADQPGHAAGADGSRRAPYLREFLSDPRVVEIPRWIWWPILNGPVLAIRRAAQRQVCRHLDPEGSPLLVGSGVRSAALNAQLALRGLELDVVLAMRYGEPSIEEALRQFAIAQRHPDADCCRFIRSTRPHDGFAVDGVNAWLAVCATFRRSAGIKHFPDDAATSMPGAPAWRPLERHGRGQCLLMIFMAAARNLDLGDPYHCECTRRHAAGPAWGWRLPVPGQLPVALRPRLRLEPSTVDTLRELAATA